MPRDIQQHTSHQNRLDRLRVQRGESGWCLHVLGNLYPAVELHPISLMAQGVNVGSVVVAGDEDA
jgi:hypothetical protein